MHHEKLTFLAMFADGFWVGKLIAWPFARCLKESFSTLKVNPSNGNRSSRVTRAVTIDWNEAVCAQSQRQKANVKESQYTASPKLTGVTRRTGFLLHPNHSWKINKVSLVLAQRSEKQTTRYFLNFMYSTSFCLCSDWKDLLYIQHWSPCVVCRRQQTFVKGTKGMCAWRFFN